MLYAAPVAAPALTVGRAGRSPSSDFAELKRRVRNAGLLSLQPWRYVAGMSVTALLLALSVAGLATLPRPWALALDAVALGLLCGQLGFHLHDAGHLQMFAAPWKNRLVGFVIGDLLLGVSFGWWMDEHTRHHANPNHMAMDPDIDNAALSYSIEQALARGPVGRLVARYQAFLLVPLASLTGWSMHAQGVQFTFRLRRRLEMAALAVHAALYLALLLLLLGPASAMLVVVVQKAATGLYFASVALPNHQGMPQTDGRPDPDFLRKQVLMTRNLRSNRLVDLWYGSLNLQIEHHLFPRMTRANLRRAQPIVRSYCEELGVPYHEVPIPTAYAELVTFLHHVGAPLRRAGGLRSTAQGSG